ncbi:MAG: protein kinase [Candidatus Aminicenantes bacterium]|nr:protein kinase [Candidatus Aminicenantes bacterium]
MTIKCSKCSTENPKTQKFCGTCGAPLRSEEAVSITKTMETPPEELATGVSFAGRYQVIEELGKGGMGNVYKAYDTEIKEKVALKLLKKEVSSDAKTIERFRNEIRLARKISHKNVGRMFDLGKEEDRYFITMEYVDGQDLKGLIRQSDHLAVDTAVKIARQVCEGLAEAHRMGVVHRDLKPGNIMVDREGNARVLDFGIARSTKEKSGELTGEGIMIGTPVYMSPEQAEAKEADERSDIYSLGVILYEMLTGRFPYEGDTSLIIAMKHKGEKPNDPREFNSQIPESLSRLIFKCLERDKKNRFQNSEEVSRELSKIADEIFTDVRTAAGVKPVAEKSRKRKIAGPVFFGGGALLLIVLVFLAVVFFPGRPQVIDSIAVLPFENESGAQDTDYLSNGLTESLINRLSKLNGLKVMARYTVFRYKGKDLDPREIGRELGVKAVLTGRINLRRELLHIGAELVNVDEGNQIWGERFERSPTDVLNIEENIVTTITEKLRLRLSQEERTHLSRFYSQDSKAYSLYLQGRHYIYGTREEMNKAMNLFQQAVDLDPGFALAHAAIAEAHTAQAYLTTKARRDALPKAKAALQRALELDENLAEAHTAAGVIKFRFDWDWPEAEKEFRLGIKLNPGSSDAHNEYGIFLMCMGRVDEGLVHAQKAYELDPLAISPAHWVAVALMSKFEFEAGDKALKKLIEFHPNWYWGYVKMAANYVFMEDFPRAIEAADKAEEMIKGRDNPLSRSWLCFVYARCGEIRRAEDTLQRIKRMEQRRYIDPWVYVEMCTPLGRIEEALDALEKAYEEGSPNIIYLKIYFILDRLREISNEPRYKKILALLNFS